MRNKNNKIAPTEDRKQIITIAESSTRNNVTRNNRAVGAIFTENIQYGFSIDLESNTYIFKLEKDNKHSIFK